MNKGNISIIIISVLAILLALVSFGAGYLWLQNQQTKQEFQDFIIESYGPDGDPPYTNSLEPEDETANWKTYSSSALSLSFKYPLTVKPTGAQNLEIIKENNDQVVIGVPQTDMLVMVTRYKNSNEVPSNWKSSGCFGEKLEGSTGVLAGEKTEVVDCNVGKNVKVTHNGQIYIIGGTNDLSNGNLLVDQVLSTFEFTGN